MDQDSKHATAENTTLILRNVPNNYSREMFLAMLDEHGFAGRYDFVYLPRDFQRKANLGYAFRELGGWRGRGRLVADLRWLLGLGPAHGQGLPSELEWPAPGLQGRGCFRLWDGSIPRAATAESRRQPSVWNFKMERELRKVESSKGWQT